MTTLGGCISSPADQLASVQTLPQSQRNTLLQKTDRVAQQRMTKDSVQSDIADQADEDANSLNVRTARDANTLNAQAEALEKPGDPNLAHAFVARKNIAATQNSIYASQNTATTDESQEGQQTSLNTNNGFQQTQTLNASQNSIYSGQTDQVARDPSTMPLPDAKHVGEVQDMALAGKDVPPDVEVASADPAADDATTLPQTSDVDDNAAQDRSLDTIPAYDKALADVEQQPAVHPKKRRLTLADFFRRKTTTDTAAFDGKRFGKDRFINTAAIPNMKTASLSDQALPGVTANAMMPVHNMSEDEMTEDGDDQPAGLMKLASLSGMMRVAPNGLWTQTDKVEIRCLRPGLVNILKQVETHYGRPVVVTSGFRDPGHNRLVGGARHSLHTLCAAADIQIDGVSKWQLADYLRSIPGRGGVGTYCHTESVHIDIGGERDWNWRCRRRRHG